MSDTLVTGYLPQTFDLPSHGSARDLLEAEKRQLGTAARCSVSEALGLFGFCDQEASLPLSKLSGGQKSRLLLARCWLSVPDLLVLDEPTNHVDLEGCEQLAQILSACPCTVIVISTIAIFWTKWPLGYWSCRLRNRRIIPATIANTVGRNRRPWSARFDSIKKNRNKSVVWRITLPARCAGFMPLTGGAGQNDYYRARAKKDGRPGESYRQKTGTDEIRGCGQAQDGEDHLP